MARLVDNWDLQKKFGTHIAWFPLLALSPIWMVIGCWYHLNLFHISAIRHPWFLWAIGNAGYLLAVATFAAFGDRHRPANVSTRIAVALAFGAAITFIAYAYTEHQASKPLAANMVNATATAADTSKTDSNDPLSPVNALAAVLAVVLAVVTLTAQKSAADAKMEAEKAREDMLRIRSETSALITASRLLERAQATRTEAEELAEQANNVATTDPNYGTYLSRAAMCLKRMERFLITLHQWLLDSHSIASREISGIGTLLILDLSLLASGPADDTRRLRTQFMLPVCKLIESIQRDGDYSRIIDSDAHELMSTFRSVIKALNEV